MREIVSRRTVALGLALTVFTLAGYAVVAGAGDDASALLANAPSVVVGVLCVAVMVWSVLKVGLGERVGRQGLWLTAGLAASVLGDTLWAYYEVVAGIDVPFPGVPDIAYLAMYVLMSVGIVRALHSFSGLFSLTQPLATGAAIALAATVALYASVFAPLIASSAGDPFARAVLIAYPVGDIWFLLMPAMALALTARQFAGGWIAWPWRIVVLAFVAIAAADVLFNIGVVNGTYHTGSPIDSLWLLGYSALAVAGSLMVDVQRPKLAWRQS